MFKFNFFDDSTPSQSSEADKVEVNDPKASDLTESIQIQIEDVDKYEKLNSKQEVEEINCGNSKLSHIIIPNNSMIVDTLDTDLISGYYEGGLKIWECTYDLLNYINAPNFIHNFKGKKVIDLGCGSGLVGILACQLGARTIFQDYNENVIQTFTISNFILNKCNIENGRFFTGDWTSFVERLATNDELNSFDYILTSETIYNPNYYQKLITLFVKLLKHDGTVYLAAKSHYFGVGGNVHEFEEMIKKCNVLDSKVCWFNSNGLKRYIVEIKFRN